MKTIKILIIIVALLSPFGNAIASKTAHGMFYSCATLPDVGFDEIMGSAVFTLLYGTKDETVNESLPFSVINLPAGTIYGYKLTYSGMTYSCPTAPDLKIIGNWYYVDDIGVEFPLINGSTLAGYPDPVTSGATMTQQIIFKISTVDASKRDGFGVPTVDIGTYFLDINLQVEYAEL